jgi:hypothetical protein
VAGYCECGDKPSVSVATELVILDTCHSHIIVLGSTTLVMSAEVCKLGIISLGSSFHCIVTFFFLSSKYSPEDHALRTIVISLHRVTSSTPYKFILDITPISHQTHAFSSCSTHNTSVQEFTEASRGDSSALRSRPMSHSLGLAQLSRSRISPRSFQHARHYMFQCTSCYSKCEFSVRNA